MKRLFGIRHRLDGQLVNLVQYAMKMDDVRKNDSKD
nr:MAG TPA: hypothetical protein [Siphoviridae sp. ctekg1]